MADAPVRSDKAQVVLQAATRVFLAQGFSAASTDAIQREAGVSKATVYACYPTKDALFAAVITDQCGRMTEGFAALEPPRGDISCTLAALGTAYLDMLLSPDGLALYRVVVAEAPRFPELGRLFYRSGPKVVADIVAGHLAQAARRGELQLHTIDADGAAGLLVSLLRGESQLECLTHPEARPSAAQRDQWVQRAVHLFLASFGGGSDVAAASSTAFHPES